MLSLTTTMPSTYYLAPFLSSIRHLPPSWLPRSLQPLASPPQRASILHPLFSIFAPLLLFLLASLAASAQPANNNFASAITLSGLFVSTNGSNVGATRESGEPFIGGNLGGASVWWNWTALDNGTAFIDTFGSSFDTILGVYTGNS